jgi:putrescine transport system substrate-binding protein
MRLAIGSATLLAAFMSLLTACDGSGRDDQRSTSAAGTAGASEEKVLHVYNWADYIGENTIRDFEARTGIKVTYDVFDSAEVLTTKLLTGGSGYDVVIPNGASTYRLGQSGTLRKLDRSSLKNLANLDPRIMQRVAANDPGNEFAVPYLWGTTGLGYNPDLVEKALGTRTIDSLAAVFDPAIASKLAACGITMLDSPADMFQVAFIYLGLDPNSQRPEDIAAAEKLLAQARPHVRYFHSSKYVGDLASGEVCVSIGWSGAVQQARSRGAEAETPVEVVYVIPREGAPVWFDMVAIPIDAPHPENAHAFLDYLMEPEVIADITNAVGQANGNVASLPHVAQALRDDPTVYPTDEVFARLTVDKAFSAEMLRTIGRAWTRIQAGQ